MASDGPMVITTLGQVGVGVIGEPATENVTREIATWIRRDVFLVDNSREFRVLMEIHRGVNTSVEKAVVQAGSKVLHVGNSDCLVAN